MTWKKVPEKNKKMLEKVMLDFPEARKKMMFGSPVYFMNGYMWIGTHEDSIFIRLSEEDQKKALSQIGITLFTPMSGRTMKGYVSLPAEIYESESNFIEWVQMSFRFVSSLPPKL